MQNKLVTKSSRFFAIYGPFSPRNEAPTQKIQCAVRCASESAGRDIHSRRHGNATLSMPPGAAKKTGSSAEFVGGCAVKRRNWKL